MQQLFRLTHADELEVTSVETLGKNHSKGSRKKLNYLKKMEDTMVALESLSILPDRYALFYIKLPISTESLLPSVQAPKLEMKSLLDHLKYVYLGENDTLPVIIAQNLTKVQEEKIIRVLREYKTAIGWTIDDIKGISPFICMLRILIEE